jgi:membrane protein
METPRVVTFAKRLVKEIGDDEVPDLAAGLAYRFLFALFPFAIFLAALSSFITPLVGITDPTSSITSALSENLPPEIAAQIEPQLRAVLGSRHPGLLSIGALLALWAAQSGVAAVIKAMNKAYDVEEARGFLHRTGLALLLTLLFSAGILLAFITIVGGSVITQELASTVGIDDATWRTITLIRYPLVLGLVAVAISVMFHFGPNLHVSYRWSLLGGFLFAITWVVATAGFGLYVANFATYGNTYGALGGVVVLLLWFYLTALMLLVAAEVTSLLAIGAEPDQVEARRREAHEIALSHRRPAGASQPISSANVPHPSIVGAGAASSWRRLGSVAVRRPLPRPTSARLTAIGVMAAGAIAGAVLGVLAGGDDGSSNSS